MPSLNDVKVKISTTADNSGIKDASNGLSGMVDNFQSGMKKISAVTGVAGAALTAFSASSVSYLKEVVTSSKALSTQTGLTVIQSSQLLAVMGRMGISTAQTTAAFKTFSKQIADSRDNTSSNASKVADLNNKIDAAKISIAKYTNEIAKNGDATGDLHNKIQAAQLAIQGYKKDIESSANTLDKLGIVTIDASGKNKDFNTILLEVADKFKAMPNGVEKTSDALALFGRSGLSMIKVLNQGSQGIQDLEAQASKLGLTLNAQNIGVISNYIASQKQLADSTNSIKIQVGTLTAPLMTRFNEALNTSIQHLVGMDSPLRNVTADILAFGGPVGGATSALTGFLGNVGSATPMLASFGRLLANPYFLAFTAAAVVAGLELNHLQHEAGGWNNLLREMHTELDLGIAKIRELWAAFTASTPVIIIVQYFQQVFVPALRAVWAAISENLLPALGQLWGSIVRLWNALQPGLLEALKVVGYIMGGLLLGAIWAVISVINILVQALSVCISAWSNTIRWISDLIGWFGNLIGVVWNAANTIIIIFRNIGPAFRDLVLFIGSIISGVGGLIVSPFRWAYDSIIGLFRNLPHELGNIINGAFGNIGKSASSTLHSLHIPGFATGGFTGIGGSNEIAGVVHKGEYVLPQSAVNQSTGQPKMMGGTSQTVNIGNVYISTPQAADAFFRNLDQDTLLSGMGLTTNRGMN